MQLHMNLEKKMREPKISKLKGGYTSSAGLVFQSWLQDICVHVQDRRLPQREAIQLVKDFTTEHASDEVEFYMGMVMEEDQSFKGLFEHLQDSFQSGETLSELISNFYGQSQKAWETQDTFADDLQVLARKIIVHKPSFHLEANNQLKAQYVHKLWDPYYAATAHGSMQSSLEEETFTRFWRCLVTMFGGHERQSRSSVTTKGIDIEVNEISGSENSLSKNSRQCQNKINRQEDQISSLKDQNSQLKGLLDSKVLVNAISQAVTTGLKLSPQPTNKGGAGTNGTGFVSKPHLGKPQPSQLLCLWTRAGEQPKVVQKYGHRKCFKVNIQPWNFSPR